MDVNAARFVAAWLDGVRRAREVQPPAIEKVNEPPTLETYFRNVVSHAGASPDDLVDGKAPKSRIDILA